MKPDSANSWPHPLHLFGITLFTVFFTFNPDASFGQEMEQAVPEKNRQRTHAEDRDIFHYLLGRGKEIRRTVKNLENGVETLTESDNPEVAAKIREHVQSMYGRVEDGRPIRMRDPLFREIFRNNGKIEMKLEETDNGVRVVETSDDAWTVKLIQAHARVVSAFVKNGFREARRNHTLPDRE